MSGDQEEAGDNVDHPMKHSEIRRGSSFKTENEWMHTMREDTFKDYEIDTITREHSRRGKPDTIELMKAGNNSPTDSAIQSEMGNGHVPDGSLEY